MAINKETELKTTHTFYNQNKAIWDRCLAAFDGTDALLNYGALYQHSRESDSNYSKRKKEAYSFNFSASIIEIFNQYLFSKVSPPMLPKELNEDELFQMFLQDCDLDGTNFDTFMSDYEKYVASLGHIGILVDRPNSKILNRSEEIEEGIYPYLNPYLPQNILNWRYTRDVVTKRPVLDYLVLRDDLTTYRVWTRENWELWRRITSNSISSMSLIDSGPNPLGEIPFVIYYNAKSLKRMIGISDIKDISRIDISIMNNLSEMEEMIDLAAFPMMRKPMKRPGQGSVNDVVGPTGVLEFDPERPESKPDWLASEVASPMDALKNWIEKKSDEIIRLAHAGSIAGIDMANAKSGVALRYEFMQLNAKLVTKSDNLVEAKEGILKYWLQWQGQSDLFNEIKFNRPKDFSLEDLESDLKSITTGMNLVMSQSFNKIAQKNIVSRVPVKLTPDEYVMVYKEIDESNPTDFNAIDDTLGRRAGIGDDAE